MPITRPVSGVAMGLIKEGDQRFISDIQGLEDFLGDMDFKVCGTTEGHHRPADGQQGQRACPEILAGPSARPNAAAPSSSTPCLRPYPLPREAVGDRARIMTIKIPVDKIRDVIGTGGKGYSRHPGETGASIEVQEDGTVHVGAVTSTASAGGQGHGPRHCQGARGGRGLRGRGLSASGTSAPS